MDELFYVLLFAFFILLPLLEKWRKARRGSAGGGLPGPRSQVPPSQRTQGGRPRQQYSEPAGPTSAGRTSSGTAAEDVIPDDLWELLTGERRRRPAPEPEFELEPEPGGPYDEPAPEPVWPPEPDPARTRAPEPEYRPARMREREWAVEADRAVRAPVPLPSPARVARSPSTYPVEARQARAARMAPMVPKALHGTFDWSIAARRHGDARGALGLHGPADLRRAVLLREVLGPPKALETGRGGGVPGLESVRHRR